MRKYVPIATTILCLLPCGALAQTVDWSHSFLFRTTGGFGFENPFIRVDFGPRDYPPDPIMPVEIDLSEPTMLTLIFPDIGVTNGAARILFAVEEDFSINAVGLPIDDVFQFETLGQGIQNFQMNMSTGSGGIPIPGTWESFNPQPEPPANFNGTAFDFDFSSNSPATLVIQAFDDGVEPLSFELIAPADFNRDGIVDSGDLGIWEDNFGTGDAGDANLNGLTDGQDFLIWQQQFGRGGASFAATTATPEPSTLLLASLAGLLFCSRRR
jgi:hypothetical protein